MEAESDKELLERQSVKSIVASDDCGGAYSGLTFVSGVKLLINEGDAEKVCRILQINNK